MMMSEILSVIMGLGVVLCYAAFAFVAITSIFYSSLCKRDRSPMTEIAVAVIRGVARDVRKRWRRRKLDKSYAKVKVIKE